MLPSDNEIENLQACFHGWRVELIQLGPQCADMDAPCASFRSHSVSWLRPGCDLAVRGTVNKASSYVLLSGSQHPSVRYLGQSLGTNLVLLAGAGARLDLFVPGGGILFMMVVGPGHYIRRCGLRICEGAAEMVRVATALARSARQGGRDERAVDDALARNLLHILSTSNCIHGSRIGLTLRASAVEAACRLFDRRFPALITLDDVSRHCGVAERTLEYGFRQVYGTTPLAFVRCQRLTRSRLALLRPTPSTSISETARACGFTHMGQYSLDYRRLFGETPSMTLARAQATLQGTRQRRIRR